MRTIQVRLFIALAAVACAAALAKPSTDSDQEASVVKGEIETSQPLAGGYTIQLYDTTRHSPSATADIRSDGVFEFRQMPYGSYQVTVTNGRGEAVYEGNVDVGGTSMPVVIRLPHDEEKARPGAGTVSVQQLQHPPSRKAFNAMRTAQKFSEAGDNVRAIEWLQKAVALSPDWADAWLNLGARHLASGHFQQAIDLTRHAIDLAGPSTKTLCNIAYAQALLGRHAEARQSAEDALRLKPDDAHAHFILGEILYMSRADDAEAVRHLRLAAPTIAGARATLAKIQGK